MSTAQKLEVVGGPHNADSQDPGAEPPPHAPGSTPSIQLIELAQKLEAAQRKRRHEAHTRPWAPSMTPATSLGYECERRTVYQRVWPDKAQPVGEELASIFEEGDLHQADVRAELLKLGFEVVEAEVNFKDRGLEISGTIDGKIEIQNPSGGRPRRIPIEVKSTSGHSPRTADEWRNSETPLLRRYFAQLQTYLFLTNEPEGLGIFKNKLTGLWTVVAVALDYEYAEALLQRASRIKGAVLAVVKDGEDRLPPRLASRSECGGCPFRDTLCLPAEADVDPLLVTEDVELLAEVERRASLDAARREFGKLDDRIKERFKLTKGDRFVVGTGWLVEKRKHGKGVRIDIRPLNEPEDETEQ